MKVLQGPLGFTEPCAKGNVSTQRLSGERNILRKGQGRSLDPRLPTTELPSTPSPFLSAP